MFREYSVAATEIISSFNLRMRDLLTNMASINCQDVHVGHWKIFVERRLDSKAEKKYTTRN